MARLVLLICVLLYTYSGIKAQDNNPEDSNTAVRILFVGNSLTYTNNLPALVKKYAGAKKITVQTQMIAFPNYAIEDHWKDGKVQQLISGKSFDFVIIQQGPSSQKDGRKMLIEYGAKFSELCQLNGAQLCYFMVWPALKYFYTFDNVILNHKDAAAINKAVLLPVGEVWKTYIDKSNDKGYYGLDGFHPSIKGSQVAAEIIVRHLFKD